MRTYQCAAMAGSLGPSWIGALQPQHGGPTGVSSGWNGLDVLPIHRTSASTKTLPATPSNKFDMAVLGMFGLIDPNNINNC